MKKLIFSVMISVILTLILCGCSLNETFASQNNEYIVSAIGFDGDGEKVKMTLEAIVVNAEDTEAERRLELLEGEGSEIEEAFLNAAQKASQPLMLNHSAVVIFGENISPKAFQKAINFCISSGEITLSAQVVTCKEASDLLTSQAVSSIAVGYDIMNMLQNQSKQKGIEYKNCIYEIEALREKPLNTAVVPFFDKTEKGYYINGLKIFKDYVLQKHIENDSASAYAIATDVQRKGTFMLGGEKIQLNSSYAQWDITKTDNLNFKLKLRITAEHKTKEQKRLIKQNIEALYNEARLEGEDIFGLGNIIFVKENNIWQEVKGDYVNQFKNSRLSVEFI